jgi:endoglucanase
MCRWSGAGILVRGEMEGSVLPRWLRAVLPLSAITLLMACETAPPPPEPAPPVPATGVRVDGNRLIDPAGRTLRLRGFDLAGAESACIDGAGFFDTPDGEAPGDATIRAMRRTWPGANTVRLPLNEQCWLGLPAAAAAFAGEAYRHTIKAFVEELNAAGFVVILDLHRTSPGDGASKQPEQMPDRDHSLAFWASVAKTFRSGALLFDLFNEPFPYATTNGDPAWQCWRSGGCTLQSVNTGRPYTAAGMNELITAVRSTGSRTPVLAAGIYRAESLTGWLAHRPSDPAGQLVASFHANSYNLYCAVLACYDRDLAPVARQVPLIAGAIGPSLGGDPAASDGDCPPSAVRSNGWSAATLDWLEAHAAGWAAWSFNPNGDCWSLTTDRSGDPTPIWGEEIRERLAATT